MAGEPFQPPGEIEEFPYPFFLFIFFLQVRFLLQCLLKGDARAFRDELCDPVHFSVAYPQGPSNIPYYGPGRHCPEGDYLRHMVLSVFLLYILDYLAPPVLAEVHVDIRHADSFGVQEPFKEEVVSDGVYFCYSETVGHQAACCRAPSRPYGDSPAAGEVYEIPDDKEVGSKTH